MLKEQAASVERTPRSLELRRQLASDGCDRSAGGQRQLHGLVFVVVNFRRDLAIVNILPTLAGVRQGHCEIESRTRPRDVFRRLR